jgi:hypothetical protein
MSKAKKEKIIKNKNNEKIRELFKKDKNGSIGKINFVVIKD